MIPLVSILLPVRDGARYLREAIDSLEAQTMADWECLAVDDGSRDATREYLCEWAERDSRVRVLDGGGRGIVQALNQGLSGARASLIARMDADDIALPMRLLKQVEFMREHPEVVACGTGVRFVDPQRRPLMEPPRYVDHGSISKALLWGDSSVIIHPTLMVRTHALRELKGYREAFRYVEDYDVYLRLLDQGQLANVSDALLEYRQHPGSINVEQRRRQKALRLAALNDYETDHGIPLTTSLVSGRDHVNTRGDLYNDWAMKAALGGHRSVAVRYAILALLREFWRPVRWMGLWRVHALPPLAPCKDRRIRGNDRS